MKMKLMTTFLVTTLFGISTAQAMPPKPEKCPTGSVIQAAGVEMIERDKDGTWVAAVISNNYDTTDAWTFVIGKIKADDANDARVKALEGLKTLKLQQGPVAIEQYNLWACAYRNAKNYPAVTVTPALGLKAAAPLVR